MSGTHPAGDPGHGHSTAAWTGVGVILLATLFVCLGMILEQKWMWILGIVGILGGVAAWIGLSKAGHGAASHSDVY